MRVEMYNSYEIRFIHQGKQISYAIIKSDGWNISFCFQRNSFAFNNNSYVHHPERDVCR